MENEKNSAGSDWNGVVHDIKCAIASVDATQIIIVNKLELLEKAMVTVREDASWVRGDVEVVHALVENMSEDVCAIGTSLREMRGAENVGPVELSPWGPWMDAAEGVIHGRVDRTEIEEEQRVHLRDEEPRHIHVPMNTETSIEETQAFDMNTEMTGGRSRSLQDVAVDGRQGDRLMASSKRPTGYVMPTPRYDSQMTLDYGSEELEQTLQSTQPGAKPYGRSLWEDFSSTVRDIAAPVIGAGTSKEGWVHCVREPGAGMDGSDGNHVEAEEFGTAGPSSINLNLTLEKPDSNTNSAVQAARGTSTVCGRGPGSRGGGRGAGRGAGRGKRLPAVYPRFGSTASIPP